MNHSDVGLYVLGAWNFVLALAVIKCVINATNHVREGSRQDAKAVAAIVHARTVRLVPDPKREDALCMQCGLAFVHGAWPIVLSNKCVGCLTVHDGYNHEEEYYDSVRGGR